MIADGESSSASKLTQYYNAIHPLAGLADAFILNGAPEPNLRVRTDLAIRVHDALKQAEIGIPFPQQDVYVRSLPPGPAVEGPAPESA